MRRFSETFPDAEIVSTLSRQMAWSHFFELIYLSFHLDMLLYNRRL